MHIVLAAALEKLCAEHQVVGIGVNSLDGLAAEALCRRALRRASVLRRTNQKQLLRCLPAAQSRLSRHSNDLSSERFSALPVGRDLYLGLIAVRIARHQQVSADAAHRAVCGGGGGDLPAVMIQRIVHAADPAQGICTCYRIICTMEVVFVRAEFGIVQIDVQRLHQRICLRVHDVHIESGERHIAGILHREHQLGIVTGADAGVAEYSRRHFGGGDRPKGEPGEGLPQIGSLAALQIHRVEAGAAVLQLDAVGAFAKLHQAERAIDRIGVRIIAHTAHHVLRFGPRVRRSRAFRPVQIHARAKLDDVKVVRVDLHVVIRDHRGRAAVHQIQCDAFETLDVCAILLLHLVQIEQSVLGVASLKLCIDPEIDDVSLRQQIPLGAGAAKVKTGELAGFIQRIDIHIVCRAGYAHMVAGNAVPVFERGIAEIHKPIQTIRFLVDNLTIDIFPAVAARAGADEVDGFCVVTRRRQKDIRHDGVVILRKHPLVFLIAYDFQSFCFIVLLHQHGRQDGPVWRLRRCAGELAAQDRQRAVAASLIVHPLTDLHRKVVVRIRRALDYTSVLGLVPIRD